ncbi:MAG: hypothetical protein M3N19_11675 [Candidatus Eremiobacteraeota bacterium]|nr:hypothetical protein [Candidatus Eremiobacteraeota bacterium]
MNFRDERAPRHIYHCVAPLGQLASTEVMGTPKGLLFHWSNRTPRGLRVVDVWESREDFDNFAERQIVPVLDLHNLDEPDLEIHETADFMLGLRSNS